jgi:hypothetical protein
MSLAVHDKLLTQQRMSVFTAALVEEYGMADSSELTDGLLLSPYAVLEAGQ